jgi:signal peptidase II
VVSTPGSTPESTAGENPEPTTPPVREGRAARAARPACLAVFVATAAVVLAADAGSKAWADHRLAGREPISLLGGLIKLVHTTNAGAAFSIGTGFTVVLSVVAAGVVAVLLRIAGRLRSTAWALALGLVLGGALGNLLDRIFRAPGTFRGQVVDWIKLPHWPVFNLADSGIVCGVVLILLLELRGVRVDGGRHVEESPGD